MLVIVVVTYFAKSENKVEKLNGYLVQRILIKVNLNFNLNFQKMLKRQFEFMKNSFLNYMIEIIYFFMKYNLLIILVNLTRFSFLKPFPVFFSFF